jgi:tetratricopeptide (TPR) repeat protein
MGGGFLRPNVVFTASVLLLASAWMMPSPLEAAPAPVGAIDSQDSTRLAEALADFGMTEMLETLVAQKQSIRNSTEGWWLLAELSIARAMQTQDLTRRDKLLNEAVADIQAALKARQRVRSDEDVLDVYRLRVKLAEVYGILKAEPYALSLMSLQGDEDDRKSLRECTTPAVALADELDRDIPKTLSQWTAEPRTLVTVVPDLRELQELSAYRLAWVRFYRALVSESGEDRDRLLRQCGQAAEKIARRKNTSELASPAMLLAGMSARERKDFSRAEELLNASLAGNPDPAVIAQAKFELVRCLVDRGDFAQAKPVAEAFRSWALSVEGSNARLRADARQAVLLHELYSRWADSVRSARPQEAAGLDQKAQESLADFLRRHGEPRVQGAFAEVVAEKYASSPAEVSLSPMVALALARHEAASSSAAAQDRAMARLQKLCETPGDSSGEVRAPAMWQLGVLYNQRKQIQEAETMFARLSVSYPNHPMAKDAARNALICCQNLFRASPGNSALRAEYIRAAEFLLAHPGWASPQESREIQMQLGEQCRRTATEATESSRKIEFYRRAMVACDAVGPEGLIGLDAAFDSLAARKELLALGDSSVTAASVAEGFRALAGKAQDAAESAAKAGVQESARHCRDLGAIADFQAATVYYEKLGRRDEAMKILAEMDARWPGASSGAQSAEYEIRALLEQERIEPAIARTRQFCRSYPAQSASLLTHLAGQARRSIAALRTQEGHEADLARYRKAYLAFAEELYRQVQHQPLPNRYSQTQLYAEALLESGQAAQAVELFRTLRTFDASRRKTGAASSSEAGKNPQPQDAVNVQGLARAYRRLGRYEPSLECYYELSQGLDREKFPSEYWAAELEYCQCMLEAFGRDPHALDRLGVRIRQLRMLDPRMGGLSAQFDGIEEHAGRLSRGQTAH